MDGWWAWRTAPDVLAVNRDRPNAFHHPGLDPRLGLENFVSPAAGIRDGLPGFHLRRRCLHGKIGFQVSLSPMPRPPNRLRACCSTAALIVIDDATAEDPCGPRVAVLTKPRSRPARQRGGHLRGNIGSGRARDRRTLPALAHPSPLFARGARDAAVAAGGGGLEGRWIGHAPAPPWIFYKLRIGRSADHPTPGPSVRPSPWRGG